MKVAVHTEGHEIRVLTQNFTGALIFSVLLRYFNLCLFILKGFGLFSGSSDFSGLKMMQCHNTLNVNT